jgi:excisionase family DNA binding protein
MSTTQKPLLSLEQAAAYLSITPRHVRQLHQSRQLAAVKVGRLVRFSEEDLSAYIDRQRVDAVVAPSPVRVTRPLAVKKVAKSGGAK